MNKKIILKPGKEKAIKNHHHWIFSGAIQEAPKGLKGDVLPVLSSQNEFLGNAYFNENCSIFGRMISFDHLSAVETIKNRLDAALVLRERLFDRKKTNAYRLVNGEGDGLPGLVIDQYNTALVIQISTLGMEKLKNIILDYLVEKLAPTTIYEKSALPSRKEEGLPMFEGLLFGENQLEHKIIENGLTFSVSLKHSQKTGFFLDHREVRHQIQKISKEKRVLNCFSYSGAFSVYAYAGGALHVDSVDISSQAIDQAKNNLLLNQFPSNGVIVADVFDFLRQRPLNYDLIILDPPAFAKRKKDIIQACRGYKDINRLALQKIPPKSLLLTCSCSYHVDQELFQKVIFQASREANRFVRIIGEHRLASDHPINICHPEGDYLKSLLLYVE